MAATAARTVSLLDADPGLGRLLTGTRLEVARRHLTARTHWVGTGPWDAERLRGAGPEHVGLLLLEGIVAREVVLADSVSCELLRRPLQRRDEHHGVRARGTEPLDRGMALLRRPGHGELVDPRIRHRARRQLVREARRTQRMPAAVAHH